MNFTPFAPPAPTFFSVKARDRYDSSLVRNFSIIISNSTDTWTQNSTEETELRFDNLTNGLYQIDFFFINDSGLPYFNHTAVNVNVSKDFEAQVFQSLLLLNLTNGLNGQALGSFGVATNFSLLNGTNGEILLYSKEGTVHTLNISSAEFPTATATYSILALANDSLTLNISPRFQFFLRREIDNSVQLA